MTTLLVYWAIVGWCGTVPRTFPPPKPDPWPWWRSALIGIAGGIGGGLLVHYGLGMTDLIATSFGALAGGRIVNEIAGSFVSAKG